MISHGDVGFLLTLRERELPEEQRSPCLDAQFQVLESFYVKAHLKFRSEEKH